MMKNNLSFNHPWLVAVWPGMGNVAINAGYYLMAKLGMDILTEFSAQELFDVEHIEVKEGLIRMPELPRSRLFAWQDPHKRNDIILFIGEAQPVTGKYAFCHRLIECAKSMNVQRVVTFASMATQMHPQKNSRVFGAATDKGSLSELQRLELEILKEGHIGGLNGALLGVAAESHLPGICLLGEMPHIFHQFPFPKASLAVLEIFTTMANVQIDFNELSDQAKAMERHLGDFLEKIEKEFERQRPSEEKTFEIEPPSKKRLSSEDKKNIEKLFEQAKKDRSKSYELKAELDRLDVFKEYEDRFLDLFKKNNGDQKSIP